MNSLLYNTYVSQFLRLHRQDPEQAQEGLKRAWEHADRDSFRISIAATLPTADETARQSLMGFLLSHDDLAGAVCDPRKLSQEDSLSLARLAQSLDGAFDVKIMNSLSARPQVEEQDASRTLQVLDAIAQRGNLLPVLSILLQHPDPRVRSKAALLAGRQSTEENNWLQTQFSEQDGRVKANMVESLWGMDDAATVELFETAAADPNQRVAANGILGLYLCGQNRAVTMLADCASRAEVPFRVSAAWAMGKTQDPRFVPLLARLVKDPNAHVRSTAMRSLARIRTYRAALDRQPPFLVRFRHAAAGDDRHIVAVVRVKGHVPHLGPNHFVVEENGQPVLNYTVVSAAATRGSLGIILPSDNDLAESHRRILTKSWRQALLEKAAEEEWCLAGYTNAGRPRGGAALHLASTTAELTVRRDEVQNQPRHGFLSALEAVLDRLAERQGSPRAVVVVGPSTLSPADGNTQAAIARLCQRAAAERTALHVVSPVVCPALKELAQGSGGSCLEASDAELFGNAVLQLLGSMFPSFALSYSSGAPSGTRIRLLVHSPIGAGESEVVSF